MVSQRQHQVRIEGMKRYQVIPYDEANKLPVGKLLDYFLENCKGMGMQYNEEQFLAIIGKVAKGVLNGQDADENDDGIEGEQMDRNHTWNRNHLRLLQLVTNDLEERGCLPPVTYIARELNLSRVTVTNHLRDLAKGERSDMIGGKIELLRERALSLIYHEGVFGVTGPDKVRAMKSFLEFTKPPPPPSTVNFIQVNKIYVTAEQIAALPVEKQRAIADIILERH